MLHLATCLAASTWASDVPDATVGNMLPDQIPELLDHPASTSARVEEARREPPSRERRLKAYNMTAVQPALLQYDGHAYFKASRKPLPHLKWSFAAFLARTTRISIDLLEFDAEPRTWPWYRLWAVRRMAGSASLWWFKFPGAPGHVPRLL